MRFHSRTVSHNKADMLKIELRPGEAVSIGGLAVVTLEAKSGQIARLSVEADKSIPVTRLGRPGAAARIASEGISRPKE